MHLRQVGLSLLVVALGGGCGGAPGSARATGSVGPYEVGVGATAFAIHDVGDYEIVDGVWTRVPQPTPAVRLYLFEAAFDPETDLRFAKAEEKLRLAEALTRGAMVRIRFPDVRLVGGGVQHEGDLGDLPQNPDDIDATWTFSAVELEPGSESPSVLPPLAGGRRWQLTLEAADLDAGGRIDGELVLTYTRIDTDPTDVVTGEVRIDFRARVVEERLGECNESTGWGLERSGEGPACAPF